MIDQLVQLALSLVGIFLLGVLATRFWPQEQTLDSARVDRALARFTESKTATASIITTDKKTALARINDKELALLHIMGDRVTVCPLMTTNVKAAIWDGARLALSLDSFTIPTTTLIFDNENDRTSANAWIASLNIASINKEQAT